MNRVGKIDLMARLKPEIDIVDQAMELDLQNLALYKRIISTYEKNELAVRDGVIQINGKPADYYVIRMDYYFVMGDNHHNSADSRYWGFVPEDHLLGKAVLVLFSVKPDSPFIGGLRKERIFRSIN